MTQNQFFKVFVNVAENENDFGNGAPDVETMARVEEMKRQERVAKGKMVALVAAQSTNHPHDAALNRHLCHAALRSGLQAERLKDERKALEAQVLAGMETDHTTSSGTSANEYFYRRGRDEGSDSSEAEDLDCSIPKGVFFHPINESSNQTCLCKLLQ